MIAMQYKIVLPADYPMEKIETRIRDKGYLLDGYPGLVFKAYLFSRKDADHYQNAVNSYAPFYVWQDHESMLSFLNSEGFKGLCEQFGRPEVKMWFVEGDPVAPSSDCHLAHIAHQTGVNTDINALNYTTWDTLEVTWITPSGPLNNEEGDIYSVGYVAHGNTSATR